MSRKTTSAEIRTYPPEHWPKEAAAAIPVAEIVSSPFNPRKTFSEAALLELMDSIIEHGLLQPVLVRPKGKKVDFRDGHWVGVEAWEIIAGERRYRAARKAKLASIPCIIRPMSDADVKAVQLVENDQRADVLPSEQAVAYKALADEIGVEATAKRAGKPLSAVRDIIRLGSLPKWCLDAVDDGSFSRSAAAIVARVPGDESRLQAAIEAVTGGSTPGVTAKGFNAAKFVKERTDSPHANACYTVHDCKRMVQENYSRELKGSPFDRKSLTLVPDAGSCDACPKRAGNDADLKAAGVREDVCTDPDCFEKKVAAWKATAVDEAKSRGLTPFEGNWPDYHHSPSGFSKLDENITKWHHDPLLGELAECGKGGKLRTLLKEAKADLKVYFAIHQDQPVELVKTADARKALVDAKVLKKEKAKKGSAGGSRNAGPTEWQIAERVALVTARYVRDSVANASSLKEPLLLAVRGLARTMTNGHACDSIEDLLGDLLPAGSEFDLDAVDAALKVLPAATLSGILAAMVCSELLQSYDADDKKLGGEFETLAGIDADVRKNLKDIAVKSLTAAAKKGGKAA